MRIARWVAGIVAGIVLLAVAAVLIVTLFVDPNRFKGRIERMVREATGQPFEIRGDLDIAWYPWLALQTGRAQLGERPPLLQWESARVGAQLIPLIRGRLIISKIRIDGLQVQLRRAADGKSNWDSLTTAGSSTGGGTSLPEIGGLEVRNGSLAYVDAQSDLRVAVSNWRLDVSEWQPGKPVEARTQFTIGTAQFNSFMSLNSMQPLRAQGALSVETSSLRRLLADLSLGGPRPRDPMALSRFKMAASWTADGTAITVKPIELQLDQTKFSGELARTDPTWTFNLKGDRIALDRYTQIEETDNEPFELPVAKLQALRVQGVLSFDEAQLAGARMKNLRLRIEDGQLHVR